MKRRDFFKIAGAGLGAIALGRFACPKIANANTTGCKIVVFGSDSLRIDYAQDLRNSGAPALSSLNPPICSISGGVSVTQPGWATVWCGAPSYYSRVWTNMKYDSMPINAHAIEKIANLYTQNNLYVGWLTGKGWLIDGRNLNAPHYPVRNMIQNGQAGKYYGDQFRPDSEVFNKGVEILQEAIQYENYICFIHFQNPDATGHQQRSYTAYMDAALQVDTYISQLMQIVLDANIIYCSDHGFNFKELGDVETNHNFSPRGMLSTNFPTIPGVKNVEQSSIARLVYRLAGGDPDHCTAGNNGAKYSMYGINLI